MDPWEPSLPGAGAQRVVLLLRLYMRMGHYSPLSVLVVDALSLTFKADGATVSELSTYLGLTLDRVEAGIEGIPKEVWCTSSDLHQENVGEDLEEAKGKGTRKRNRQDGTEESSLRYYINYTALLPFIFAHVSHILLSLSQLPVPQQTGSGGIGGEIASLNISPTLRRTDGKRGLCCTSCRYWMALKDIRLTISRCPLCQSDILGSILRGIKSRYDEKLMRSQQLLSFGPLQQRGLSSSKPTETVQGVASKVTGNDTADYPLARDPFLVQQGLFFHFLFSQPFVCINDTAFVVDVDEIMTKAEYECRSMHRATVLDQFRLVHRNAAAIRVKLVDQEKLDADRCLLSVMKLTKRGQLPPWLRPAPLFPEGNEPPLPPIENEKQEDVSAGAAGTRVAKRVRREHDIVANARYIARQFFDDDYDEESNLNGLKELVILFSNDGVSLNSVVNGLPEEYHDALAENLADVLYIASEVVPVETSRILSTLLRMELDRATQRRNDVHTFMRGNGVVPKVFEGLLAKVTSAPGGLEEQLVNCCINLCEKSVLSNSTKTSEEDFISSVDNVTTSSTALLLEGLDYFNSEAAQLLVGNDESSCDKSAYATIIVAMSLRILDVVHASLREWPWSLREGLRGLVETIEVRLEKKTNSLLKVKDNDFLKLTSLGQNVMATIVVLRAVIPALLSTVPRLLPGECCFDRNYILLQKRFKMLAKVIQKAAHGLLFNAPHEKGIIAFNNELPALTQHCSNVFVRISIITEPPIPSQEKSILERGAEVTLKFRNFLDNHVVYLINASLKCNPFMEPLYWIQIIRLTAYAENRLAYIDRFIQPSLSSEMEYPSNVEEPSSVLRRPRRVIGFLSRLFNIRLPHEIHTISTGGRSGINSSNNDSINVIASKHEEIFNELISYALRVTVKSSITGLHVCFCSTIGIASDNTIAIVVYWDLLRIYLEN
ncbi:Ras GTPase-activating domain [Trypanosoma melophagium]|uniref:Ras GTPase-activating domain n=1 Tax=Trypanosoma melophagium TaxID=715481 RepID=UPI00351A5F65|nr:Ras GTPase-activating domain [Trypanosoma melophagium]